mmetsp:Transcript_89795/g.228419  ORF Transcript_89795/g.228419 Transcript_89795/m.228419 type:complete len:209 (+) Transcript_89795:1516-2142(+)
MRRRRRRRTKQRRRRIRKASRRKRRRTLRRRTIRRRRRRTIRKRWTRTARLLKRRMMRTRRRRWRIRWRWLRSGRCRRGCRARRTRSLNGCVSRRSSSVMSPRTRQRWRSLRILGRIRCCWRSLRICRRGLPACLSHSPPTSTTIHAGRILKTICWRPVVPLVTPGSPSGPTQASPTRRSALRIQNIVPWHLRTPRPMTLSPPSVYRS